MKCKFNEHKFHWQPLIQKWWCIHCHHYVEDTWD